MNGIYPGAPDLANMVSEKDLDIGDVDGDGDLDLVVAQKSVVSEPNFPGVSNLLLLNDGGSFVDFTDKTDFASFASASRDVELFDADGDGWLDVLFCNTGILHPTGSTAPSQPRLHRNLGLDASGVWLGFQEVPRSTWLEFHHYLPPFGSGQMQGVLDHMEPAPRFCGVTSGNVSGSALPDVFFVDYQNDLGHRYQENLSTPGNFRFVDRTDDPAGVLAGMNNFDRLRSQVGAQVSVVQNFTTGAEMADLNLDGWLEIVAFTDSLNGGAKVIFSKNGQFRSLSEEHHDAIYSGGLIDFNMDGRIDLYIGSDHCDGIRSNDPWSGPGQEPEFYLGWKIPDLPGAGIAESFLTGSVAGCINSADLDRDGLPDVAVADIDVSADNGCGSQGEPRLHVLLNTTPDPQGSNPFADPDSCALMVHGRTGTPDPVNTCDPHYTSVQPWNVNGVFDMEFIDLDKDGFQDMLLAGCDKFEYWRMQGFESALNYCEAVPNSTGQAAKIGWSGSLSIGQNNFTLNVADAAPGQIAQFFYGPDQVAVPFGDGLRCAGGPLQRLATFSLDGSGRGSQQIDFTVPPASSGSGQITAGVTVNFQCFFRDSGSTGSGSNYSDALSVYFAP